ncbi:MULTISPECIES: hypothetical protein [unclassified Haloferax]|uniref:hypothetical protein n=1 Tax=unclassified Haloferax TaxID=2625095 RepID=UPI0028745F77|nr:MULTISPECIES: hypothetical protein [unclassified Haloferax]MDS0243767.1 hypothetical protein [Haloferax sp. S2CR25]MDS0446888.1 hypothetical protein [Haloferax sp. S2CR25-2]
MSVPGEENPALYRTLKDILERQAEVVSVWFEPDAIQKRYLACEIDPQRVVPSSGPEPPRLEIHWKLRPPHDEFRIDYADPNLDFHCGWHQDEDHNDLGTAHFQFQTALMETPHHEGIVFKTESPPKILWKCCEELFEDVIPTYTSDL